MDAEGDRARRLQGRARESLPLITRTLLGSYLVNLCSARMSNVPVCCDHPMIHAKAREVLRGRLYQYISFFELPAVGCPVESHSTKAPRAGGRAAHCLDASKNLL